MSSIQEQLVAQLNGVAAGGIWAIIAKQGASLPYITYQRITNTTNNVLAGNGNPPVENTRIQIDVWGTTYAEAQAIAAAVKAAMLAWAVQNVLLLDYDLYEQDVKIYRVLLEYSIWA